MWRCSSREPPSRSVPVPWSGQPNPLGDRICQVQLAAFNGLPSRFAIAYFHKDRLRGFKVGYQRPYHGQLLQYLQTTLGKAVAEQANGAPGVYSWKVGDGELVALAEHSLEGNEPALFWKGQPKAVQPTPLPPAE